jgi:ABC-type nitrate/sulfonate/bicarbonate transport system ATPase subunit
MLRLPSLEVKNFRAFRRLLIPSLRRVNLIVGKNGVGKSTVLEAVRAYAGRGDPAVLYDILKERHEDRRPEAGEEPGGSRVVPLWHLFHGRHPGEGPFTIGPSGVPDSRLVVRLRDAADGEGQVALSFAQRGVDGQHGPPVMIAEFGGQTRQAILLLEDTVTSLSWRYLVSRHPMPAPGAIRSTLVAANGAPDLDVGEWWDAVALTRLEDDVLAALRIIERDVERLTLVGGEDTTRRVMLVRLKGSERPVPLRSLGDGMSRILEIALALANAREGFLLVDEVENGVHYAAQCRLWRVIFGMARRLDIQVFATTHSWDCLEAFKKAAVEEHTEEGCLVRLERQPDQPGEIRATTFTEAELAIVTRDKIEVR